MMVQIVDHFGDKIALLEVKSDIDSFNRFFQNYKAIKYDFEERTKESRDEPEGLLEFLDLLKVDVKRVFIEENLIL